MYRENAADPRKKICNQTGISSCQINSLWDSRHIIIGITHMDNQNYSGKIMRSARIQLLISVAVLTVMIVTLIVAVYWVFWPINILKINKVELITGKVAQGGRLEYVVHYNKLRQITGEITRQLIGADGKKTVWSVLDKSGGNLPCGDNLTFTTGVVIPYTTPPGKYVMHTTVRYQVNPLRFVLEEFNTPVFEVIK